MGTMASQTTGVTIVWSAVYDVWFEFVKRMFGTLILISLKFVKIKLAFVLKLDVEMISINENISTMLGEYFIKRHIFIHFITSSTMAADGLAKQGAEVSADMRCQHCAQSNILNGWNIKTEFIVTK